MLNVFGGLKGLVDLSRQVSLLQPLLAIIAALRSQSVSLAGSPFPFQAVFLWNCVKRPWQYGAVSENLSSFLSRGFTSKLAYDFDRHDDLKFRINGGE